MAEKVDKTPAAAHLLLSMPLEKKMMKKQARAARVLPAVRDVIQWTLFHAGIFAFSFVFSTAYILIVTDPIVTSISQAPSFLLPGPVEMTEAEEDVTGALGTLWCVCVVSQAAAGVLALKLPRHRLLLAYAALVATAAGHSMYAGMSRMFIAADPDGLYFRTVCTLAILIFSVGDVVCFVGLVVRGGEE